MLETFFQFCVEQEMYGTDQYRILNERELILRRIGRELRHRAAHTLLEPFTDRMLELLAHLPMGYRPEAPVGGKT